MMHLFRRWGFVFLVAAVVSASPCAARADEYSATTLANIAKTLIRFGAIDIRRDDVIDLFSRITVCQSYKAYYRDDFKWERIRKEMRKIIRDGVAAYPYAFKYDAVLQLDRYDFKAGMYRFTDKTAQTSSNVFTIAVHNEDFCTPEQNALLPYTYKFVLDQPVKMTGLPLSAEEGKQLLARMVVSKNVDRLIYTRFNIRVVYVAPIAATSQEERERRGDTLRVTQDTGVDYIKLDSRLDSIEYFEDPERTKLIYSFRP